MRPILELKRELCASPFYQTDSILYFASVEQARKVCLDAIPGLTQEFSSLGFLKFLKIYVKALISHLLQTIHLCWVGGAGAKCEVDLSLR